MGNCVKSTLLPIYLVVSILHLAGLRMIGYVLFWQLKVMRTDLILQVEVQGMHLMGLGELG